MSRLKVFWSRICGLLNVSKSDATTDEEIQVHLDLLSERFVRAGMPPDEAKYAALRQFGGVTRLKEKQHETRTFRWAENLFRDLKYGLRSAIKNAGFTAAVAATLALGIGANVAIYSAINAILLRPLPFKDSEKIVVLWGVNADGSGWRGKQNFSAPNYFDIKEQSHSFQSIGTFNHQMFVLTDGAPVQVKAGVVTATFFDVLGVRPVLGRSFDSEEEQAGRNDIVLLSHSLWQSRFHSDPSIVGHVVRLNATPYTVVGVLPEFDFRIPDYFTRSDLWIPALVPSAGAERTHNYLNVIARLKSGVSMQRAQQDVNIVTSRLARQYPNELTGLRTVLVQLHDQVVGDVRSILLISFGAVGFVLLIACSNVANLQLSRSATRAKEIALRLALGATRRRAIGQLLTESIVLALIGGALGVALAWCAVRFLTGLDPLSAAETNALSIDFSVLVYSLLVSIFTGVLFGLAAAWKSCPTNLWESLKEGGRGSATGDSGNRLRNMLTVAEVGLAVVLLVSAGLLIRSFIKLVQVNPGFRPEGVSALQINLPSYSYRNASSKALFYEQVVREIQLLPGIVTAGAINDLPLTHDADSDTFSIENQTNGLDPRKLPVAQDRLTTPGYFQAMRIPLLKGRFFSQFDSARGAPVVIVNEAFARLFFPHANPLGRRIKFGPYDAVRPWATIVGVVGDIRDVNLASEPDIEVYAPYQQNVLPYDALTSMTIVMRSAAGQTISGHELIQTIRAVDKSLPIPLLQTMEEVMATSIAQRRTNMLLLGVFALVALLLSGIGVYGVISYSVACRTSEIGIRMAVGAREHEILTMIVGQGLKLTIAGVLAGVLAAIAAARLLKAMLFQIATWDPVTFGAICLLVVCLATLASYIPARRATRIDPLIALRHE